MATSKQARGTVKSLGDLTDLSFGIAGASSPLPNIDADTTSVVMTATPTQQPHDDGVSPEVMQFLMMGGTVLQAETPTPQPEGFDKEIFKDALLAMLVAEGVSEKHLDLMKRNVDFVDEGFEEFQAMFPNDAVAAAKAAVNIFKKHQPALFKQQKAPMTTQAPQAATQQQTPPTTDSAVGGGNVPPTAPRKFTSFSDRSNPVVGSGVAVGKNTKAISLKEFEGKYQAYVDEKFDVAYSVATEASLAYIYEYCVHIKDVVKHQTGYDLKEVELNGMFRESVVAHVYGLGDGLAVPLSVMKDVFQTMLQALMAMHTKKKHRATDVEESKSLIYRTDLELSDYFFAAVAVGAVALCGYVLYRVARSYFAGGKEQA